MRLEEHDLERILRREELTLEDVKVVLRNVRYDEDDSERIAYANTLLREAECPSSNALRQFTALRSGGSSSSVGLS